MNLESVIAAASGREKADILFINGRVINVFTGEILEQSVAVKDGYICGLTNSGSYSECDSKIYGAVDDNYTAYKIVDLQGMYVAPGFIDAHVHIESSMVTPAQFARGIVPCGTTTVVADPHEIANVMGVEGIEYMIKSAHNQPMNILFTLPSCVPATNMETSGAILNADKITPLLGNDKIVALAEMMNYPGVIFADPDVIAKIEAAHKTRKSVDGHAPKVTGKNLNAYASAGIYSDHECTTSDEALEKLRLGIHIMVREGTCAKNLDDLFPAINDNTWHQMMWCTDDRHPEDILHEGHVDHIIRRAIKSGVSPVRAIQMATINAARYFGLRDVGAVVPGRRADIVLFKDIENPVIEKVFVKGVLVAQDGILNQEIGDFTGTAPPKIMNFDLSAVDFAIDYPIKKSLSYDHTNQIKTNTARVIKVIPHQVLTEEILMDVLKKDGYALSDTNRDMLKIAVIERYSGKTGMTKGFVNGLGLKRGAIASTVAHDSHNVIVAGTDDSDMLCAVKAIKEMGGGFAVVCSGDVIASLALPVAGLMSESSLKEVNTSMDRVTNAVKSLGSQLPDPFMILGFLALPVIPKLKITDKGLVDVAKFQIVELFSD
ncbi:MAG: adenine deaminase [Desulfamplus sp.]|nr:adenine deaminase [Desulfamplus sp.]